MNLYESRYVCSRLAEDFHRREKEAQVDGNAFTNQAKQETLDRVDFFGSFILSTSIYVEHMS